MAPDMLLRKLAYLRRLLTDLAPYEKADLAQVLADNYKLERIFEMLVVVSTDVLHHQLAERDIFADTFRETYQLAAAQGLIPADLADRLQNAAGMRNIIVHLYERVDYAILRDSIAPALRDFSQFVALFEEQTHITP